MENEVDTWDKCVYNARTMLKDIRGNENVTKLVNVLHQLAYAVELLAVQMEERDRLT